MEDLKLKPKKMTRRGSHGFSGGKFWDIFIEGKKAAIGFVGFEPTGYMKVYVTPSQRGRGIAGQAEDILANQEGLSMYVTDIDDHNINSLKAHIKGGFEPAGHQFYVKEYPHNVTYNGHGKDRRR